MARKKKGPKWVFVLLASCQNGRTYYFVPIKQARFCIGFFLSFQTYNSIFLNFVPIIILKMCDLKDILFCDPGVVMGPWINVALYVNRWRKLHDTNVINLNSPSFFFFLFVFSVFFFLWTSFSYRPQSESQPSFKSFHW